jgi:hypothetical protein
MPGIPALKYNIVFQCAVIHGMMFFLANVANGDPLLGLFADAETSRIPRPVRRTPRTIARIAEIATIAQLLIIGNFAVVLRRSAMPLPACP